MQPRADGNPSEMFPRVPHGGGGRQSGNEPFRSKRRPAVRETSQKFGSCKKTNRQTAHIGGKGAVLASGRATITGEWLYNRLCQNLRLGCRIRRITNIFVCNPCASIVVIILFVV